MFYYFIFIGFINYGYFYFHCNFHYFLSWALPFWFGCCSAAAALGEDVHCHLAEVLLSHALKAAPGWCSGPRRGRFPLSAFPPTNFFRAQPLSQFLSLSVKGGVEGQGVGWGLFFVSDEAKA